MTMVSERGKREMLPRSPAANHADGGDAYPEMSGRILKGSPALAHGVYFAHTGIIQFGHAVLRALSSVLVSKHGARMALVFRLRDVFKVVRPSVVLVPVDMVDFEAVGTRPDKGSCYQVVDGEFSRLAAESSAANVHARVTGGVVGLGTQDSDDANPPISARFISSETWYWRPVLSHCCILTAACLHFN